MPPFRPSDHLEKRTAKEPFEVEMLDGSVFTLADPKKLHVTRLVRLDVNDPIGALSILLGDAYDAFMAHAEVNGEWLELVLEEWRRHYDLPLPGEAPASSR